MTDNDKALATELRGIAAELSCNQYAAQVWVIGQAANRIEAQAAEIERLRAENLHLRCALAGIANAMAQYTTVANMHVDAIGKGVRKRARIALANHTDAGQPWLRTYDAHLKRECERCCGNGQTYGPNSGEDIVCPDCEGTGRVD